jgi:hypothetical protein
VDGRNVKAPKTFIPSSTINLTDLPLRPFSSL